MDPDPDDAHLVRVIEYDVPDRAGNGTGELIVLLSTIIDPAELVARAAEAADLDPDRISFTRTLRLVRRRQFLETELPPQFPLLHHRRRGRRVEPLRISRR
jgi:hypothetical protein